MIFYTADTHFRYQPILASRPFETTEQMDEALIAGWNQTVGPEDTVYFLGDVGFNGGHVPCRILSRLNGRKHLVRGNHDTGFVDAVLLYRYFESVTDFLEIEDGPHHILLSHYPMVYNKPKGYMIHGHLHAQGGFFHELLRSLPRVLNAGADVNNLLPVTLEELIRNNEVFYSQSLPAQHYQRGKEGFLPPVPDFRPVPLKPLPHPKDLILTGAPALCRAVLDALLDGRDMAISPVAHPQPEAEILTAEENTLSAAAKSPIPVYGILPPECPVPADLDAFVVSVTAENQKDLPALLLTRGW